MKSKRKSYLLESEIKLSKEERRAFMESVKQYSRFKEVIFRESLDGKTGKVVPFSKKLGEVKTQLGEMIEHAHSFMVNEADGEWFDKVMIQRDAKRITETYKLFEKTCSEMVVLQQRLEACYDDIGTGLSRYYEV